MPLYRPSGLLDLTEWGKICPAGERSGQLACSNDEEQWAKRLRTATLHGWRLGDEDFVREISELARRDLMPCPRGKPRGNDNFATLVAASVGTAG